MALTSLFCLVAKRWDIIQGQWPGYTMPDAIILVGGVSVGDVWVGNSYVGTVYLPMGWVYIHDDVIKGKHVPHYWPFVREIPPVPGEFPSQRPVTRNFGVFFDLRLNRRLSKQSWGWWLERPSRPLWRHCNVPRELDWRRHFFVTDRDYGKRQKLRMVRLYLGVTNSVISGVIVLISLANIIHTCVYVYIVKPDWSYLCKLTSQTLTLQTKICIQPELVFKRQKSLDRKCLAR